MLEDDFLAAFAVKRYVASQQFIENDPQRVDVDLFAVFPFANLRGHVVKGTNTFGLATATRGANVFGKAVIADLDQTAVREYVGRFQIAMHDSLVM